MSDLGLKVNGHSYYNLCLIKLNISILTGKRNATVKFCHALHVAHKNELQMLTMARILSQASGLFKFVDFVKPGMLAYIHVYILTDFSIFLLGNLSQILDVAFLLPVLIV